MKFVDLFAGLGGFHLALKRLGHKCVFACEINEALCELYKKNFGIEAKRDIRLIKPSDIPSHDILCAGFPCQPFSKAGKQKGMDDETNGNLFNDIVEILKVRRPKYFILENVPFIRQHDNEKTWKHIVKRLENELKYHIDHRVYSPHEFGIPQHRKRIFIIGSLNELRSFSASPYRVEQIDTNQFKNEFYNHYNPISQLLTARGINKHNYKSVTRKKLSIVFNELINIPNLIQLLNYNSDLSKAQSDKANPNTIIKNKQKMAKIYPRTLEKTKCFNWPDSNIDAEINIKSILEENPSDARKLEKDRIECLKIWQEFIDCIPKEDKLPGFPIWSMEFGATYPFEKATPSSLNQNKLSRFRGSFGVPLKGLSKKEQLSKLPSYARVKRSFPYWKRNFIKWNREFYAKYKKQIDPVLKKIVELKTPSWHKFEWNCQDSERIINNYIIQFRASGVRVKKTDFSPSLVCTNTQVPIIGWENRYISRKEGARLQSIEGIKLPENDNVCFKALGNAVNSHIVSLIAKELIK